ncbi:MAG: hypothetical protein ACREXP_00225 [Steroidobacteraceae bacterium]
MTLDEWAERWGIPDEAVRELAIVGDYVPDPGPDNRIKTERGVQDRVRYQAALNGWHLWRNNRGAGCVVNPKHLCPSCVERVGPFIRWGLANDSKQLGDFLKSADLIGWRPRLISVDDVGKIVAQFVSRECKKPGWRQDDSPETQAQVRWHALVQANGGDSAIISTVGTIHA